MDPVISIVLRNSREGVCTRIKTLRGLESEPSLLEFSALPARQKRRTMASGQGPHDQRLYFSKH